MTAETETTPTETTAATPAPAAPKRSAQEKIALIGASQRKASLPTFGIGDQVRVQVKIPEGDKTRLQPFEGTVIGKSGGGLSERFTVRRVTFGEGVEKVFPIHSPWVERIEVLRSGNVRRAKLYYLRKQVGTKMLRETTAQE